MPYDVLKLLPDNESTIFYGLPVYLCSAKWSRAHVPTKRCREPSAELENVKAASTLCICNEGERIGRLFSVAC